MIDELRAQLGALVAELGARRASIVPAGAAAPPLTGGGVRTLPLGQGARLELELGPIGRSSDDVDQALELAVRALRQVARRGDGAWPALSVASASPVRIRDRVATYVSALASIQHARSALVTVRGVEVVAAPPPDASERARLPLLVKRLEAAARRANSSHGELTDPDVYAIGFWHRAALILFFVGDYPVDFVRHRARLVTRELAELLPDLEPEPTTPVAVQPPPR
ncbi:MAG: hypothetical protein R3B06_18785 [Kofleriaceae bacterium]